MQREACRQHLRWNSSGKHNQEFNKRHPVITARCACTVMTLAENPNLEGLYPFLHGKKQDAASMNAALLESVTQKAAHHHEVIDTFSAGMANQLSARPEPTRECYG